MSGNALLWPGGSRVGLVSDSAIAFAIRPIRTCRSRRAAGMFDFAFRSCDVSSRILPENRAYFQHFFQAKRGGGRGRREFFGVDPKKVGAFARSRAVGFRREDPIWLPQPSVSRPPGGSSETLRSQEQNSRPGTGLVEQYFFWVDTKKVPLFQRPKKPKKVPRGVRESSTFATRCATRGPDRYALNSRLRKKNGEKMP